MKQNHHVGWETIAVLKSYIYYLVVVTGENDASYQSLPDSFKNLEPSNSRQEDIRTLSITLRLTPPGF